MTEIVETPEPPELVHQVQAAGLSTNYLEAGDGRPVVLIHGSGPGVSAYANWRLTIDALEPHLRVLAPDLVGFGFTERPADVSYDLSLWLDHLRRFLDAVGLERTNIVGNSWGGALALALAASEPNRVERLVLSGSIGLSFTMTEGLASVWGYQPSLENMRRVCETLMNDRTLVTEEIVEDRYRSSVADGVQESYAQMFPAPHQRWLDAMATSESLIASIPHETLIVHGRDDKVVPLETAYRLLELIDRSELHVYGSCGHLPQVERAGAFGALVAEFLCR